MVYFGRLLLHISKDFSHVIHIPYPVLVQGTGRNSMRLLFHCHVFSQCKYKILFTTEIQQMQPTKRRAAYYGGNNYHNKPDADRFPKPTEVMIQLASLVPGHHPEVDHGLEAR